MASILRCPSCQKPLSVGAETNGKTKVVYLWCSYGPCQPPSLGDKFSGPNLESAWKDLETKYQEWLGTQAE